MSNIKRSPNFFMLPGKLDDIPSINDGAVKARQIKQSIDEKINFGQFKAVDIRLDLPAKKGKEAYIIQKAANIILTTEAVELFKESLASIMERYAVRMNDDKHAKEMYDKYRALTEELMRIRNIVNP